MTYSTGPMSWVDLFSRLFLSGHGDTYQPVVRHPVGVIESAFGLSRSPFRSRLLCLLSPVWPGARTEFD